MQQPLIPLNDGHKIPQLGLGVWQIPDHQAPLLIGQALEEGYGLVDTAASYGNEAGVGRAVRSARQAGRSVFVTTKLAIEDQGYDTALRGFDRSLARLGLDAVDLYLIHWPAPSRNAYVDTWRALIRLREEGRALSIGVSNFTIGHLQRLQRETGVMPAVNQIELHPQFQQRALREFQRAAGIATEAWSPLGRGTILRDKTIQQIALKHGKTPAQVVLRWHVELGGVVIPKSASPDRIRENIGIFDFRLDLDDLRRMSLLDRKGGRLGQDPDRYDGTEPTLLARFGGAIRQPAKIGRRVKRLVGWM
jgi:2,5-diketo-D-gluconate reductase A